MEFNFMFLQILALFILIVAARDVTAAISSNPVGCVSTCGDLVIPFPFGISSDCFLQDAYNSFGITCNDTFQPPRPFLWESNVHVTNISLDGEITILSFPARGCFDTSGAAIAGNVDAFVRLPKFPVSYKRNKFTGVGCFTTALISGSLGDHTYTTGCVSLCDSIDSIVNGSCMGIGCCQSTIPQGVKDFTMTINNPRNDSILKIFPCSYAFVVQEDAYDFSSLDLNNLTGVSMFPVVLDWTVGSETCEEAQKNQTSYACAALHSDCINSTNGPGYRCICSSGYEGNPYLPGGCTDIDECKGPYPCFSTAICTNQPGSFACSCPKGFEGNGTQSCTRKSQRSVNLGIPLGVSMSFLCITLASSLAYFLMGRRKLVKMREKFFEKNGGIMLTERLSKHEGAVRTARIFTAEDLNKATNNYHESRILGQGGFGTVYKGVIQPNNTEVAIKKSKVSDQSQIEQFINEVIILSQINHRNVVKLLGCCLETEVPMLVYEFITNGTLSEHIHDKGVSSSTLSWETRLKIAIETARAIAYLHSATSTPIIHRDIKSTNILLDENYNAKVADFGASKLVPLDHAQLTTLVQGTFGYLDPEYFHSSQLNEKSDVYSFGVLLAELLTGEKAISFARPEKDRCLATYFVSTVQQRHSMLDIVDKRLVIEHNIMQIQGVAFLAERCLSMKGEERPCMKDVATELEGLMKTAVQHLWVDNDSNTSQKETEYLLKESIPSDTYGFVDEGNSTSYISASGFDSMRDQMTRQLQLR